jgi:N6-adenosine-specific RNA methylase IME4
MTKYSLICADPAWNFKDKLTMSSVPRGSAANYKEMELQDIIDLPIKDLAEKDAILAMWCPASMLEDGLQVMKAWGFKYKTTFTWVKVFTKSGKFSVGMGSYFRSCTEYALIGRRGKPKRINKGQLNVDISPPLKHSQKPETLQNRLELMYPNSTNLELFARRDRPGWLCTGLECPSTLGVDLRDWCKQNT